jgi:hypothetical protein
MKCCATEALPAKLTGGVKILFGFVADVLPETPQVALSAKRPPLNATELFDQDGRDRHMRVRVLLI